MTVKALSSKKNSESQGATLLGPGDFPLGSVQSRAAARLRLQLVGINGEPVFDCICFPEEEQPSFGFSVEMEIARKVNCPLHDAGFTPIPQLYIAKRFRQQIWKDLWSRHSDQYRKAWFARFPPDVWPAEEEETENGNISLKLKDGTRLLAYEPVWRAQLCGE
ncbi:MAG: hypothetical protein ABR921_07740 [Candidatus Sulfotelmatobacter sp.]|jgi:hypothetical protein